MNTDKDIVQVKENLVDLNEWGTDAVGGNALKFMNRNFISDEMAESKYVNDTRIY